ncbi:Alpha/beta hydrolase family protein [compost metagenome]
MTTVLNMHGSTGQIEVLKDGPEQPLAVAIVAHPHPLLGGNANHKVPFTLARTLNRLGVLTWRPNSRGIGQSEGEFDHGNLETEDLLQLAAQLVAQHPELPLFLVGFSFGAHICARTARALLTSGKNLKDLIVCGMPHGQVSHDRQYESPIASQACIIHGELDENVPLQQAFDWADQAKLPVSVIPGADHFFSGKLNILSRIVSDRVELQLLASCSMGNGGGSR